MSDLFERLAAPFPPEAVSWRVGTSNKKRRQRETNDKDAKATKGMALAYIDARDVMDRLDEVCGPDGWQCRYPHANGKTVCEIDVWVDGRGWITKADGAGDTDHEAEKGALSDSFKRAAVRWGIGRYLYHLPSPWVDLDDREQIKPEEMRKLEALLSRQAPAKAAPPERNMIDLAIDLLRGCSSDKALFKEAWEKNKDGWKAAMAEGDYARLVGEMKRIAATLSEEPQPQPKADEFGLNGDNVPEFS